MINVTNLNILSALRGEKRSSNNKKKKKKTKVIKHTLTYVGPNPV